MILEEQLNESSFPQKDIHPPLVHEDTNKFESHGLEDEDDAYFIAKVWAV